MFSISVRLINGSTLLYCGVILFFDRDGNYHIKRLVVPELGIKQETIIPIDVVESFLVH